jgi:hypothetical protein
MGIAKLAIAGAYQTRAEIEKPQNDSAGMTG